MTPVAKARYDIIGVDNRGLAALPPVLLHHIKTNPA